MRQFARTVTDQNPFKVAFERMQAIAGEVKPLRGCGLIENGQDLLNCGGQIRSYSTSVVAFVEAFKAPVLEAPNH